MHCWVRAIPSVWLLFVLCYGPFCWRTPFMHEWVNEDQNMMVWTLLVESAVVPPRTRLGIVCCEISVMVRHMTRRIFWQVVMSDMAHLNRLVLQNQQTRALLE